MVQTDAPRPFISLESNTYSHPQTGSDLIVGPFRSNNSILWRKVEVQAPILSATSSQNNSPATGSIPVNLIELRRAHKSPRVASSGLKRIARAVLHFASMLLAPARTAIIARCPSWRDRERQ